MIYEFMISLSFTTHLQRYVYNRKHCTKIHLELADLGGLINIVNCK